MGIIFQPYYDNAPDIIIGGVKDSTDFAGGKTGVTGPFPKYSISREDLSAGDGTYLRSKYSITVTGTATIKSNTAQDATVKGQRQNAIQGEAMIVSNLNLQKAAQHGNGKLTITPYGGHANKIIFSDARLLSVEMPEQNEESLGVQNLEYSLSFEAYLNKSISSSTGSAAADVTVLNVSSAEESWELTANEGTFSFEDNAFTATAPAPTIPPKGALIKAPHKTFTLTHTLNAVGIKTFNDAIPEVGDSPAVPTTVTTAWKSARDWVKSRMCKNVETNITTGVNNAENTERADTIFNPLKMGDDTDFMDLSEFKSYNLVRTFSSDIAGGSYGVTETWLISEESQAVTHEIDASVENSQEAPAASVTVNGTIQGLEKVSTSDLAITTKGSKYANALGALSTVLKNAYGLANSVYTSSGIGGTLRTIIINQTLGHNQVTGTITWSVTFDDLVVTFPNAVREDINLTYDNEFGTNKVVAILAILDKANGPIIQDIGTTQEKKVSLSIDLVMDKATRSIKPSQVADPDAEDDPAKVLESMIASYQPSATKVDDPVYQESRSETWNPKTGAFNVSIGWVYI
jgi:hypothetical protein